VTPPEHVHENHIENACAAVEHTDEGGGGRDLEVDRDAPPTRRRGLEISAGEMSALWTGTPTTIWLDDLDVICSVLGCAPD
jgi:Cro/C1-type HTH DNA-binding domain